MSETRAKTRRLRLSVTELLLAISILGVTSWGTAWVLQRFEARQDDRAALARAEWQRALRDASLPLPGAAENHEEWETAVVPVLGLAARGHAQVEDISRLLEAEPVPAGASKPAMAGRWLSAETLMWILDRTFADGLDMKARVFAHVDVDDRVLELLIEVDFLAGPMPDGISSYSLSRPGLETRKPNSMEYGIGILVGLPIALLLLALSRWLRARRNDP